MSEPNLGNCLPSANEAMRALYKPHLQTQTNITCISSIFRGRSYWGINEQAKELREDCSRRIVAKVGIFLV